MDSMLVSESSASASFSSDVGTAALLMLVTGFPEQAARLLASVGLVAANQQVYDE